MVHVLEIMPSFGIIPTCVFEADSLQTGRLLLRTGSYFQRSGSKNMGLYVGRFQKSSRKFANGSSGVPFRSFNFIFFSRME